MHPSPSKKPAIYAISSFVTYLLSYPRCCPFECSVNSIRVSPILVRFVVPHYYGRTQCNLRSEPSSRAVLTGEQPDPWKLLHLQDTTSRHRGAEPRRRYGRSGATSLFNHFND